MSEQLRTFYSSRTEDLVAKLLLNLTTDEQFFLNQPFGQCTVLVPNSGMQRYLELQIARTFGICSHIQIIYPAKFLWQLYQQLLPEVVAPDSLDVRRLTFQLLALWQSEAVFLSPLQGLLNQHQQPKQRYLLAANIARLFKQYFNERPDMIAAWQQHSVSEQHRAAAQSHRHWAWQRNLFHQLNLSAFSRDALVKSFHDALPGADSLPGHVHVFGFHALPPAQLTDLLVLATQTAVSFYTFNPSMAYWQDIVPEQFKYRSELTAENEAALMTVGHPLLAAWGQGGKYLIERLNEYDCTQLAATDQRQPLTILEQLQDSIERLTEIDSQQWLSCFANEPSSFHEGEKGTFDLPSVSLHIASSPRREVEILYDNILNLLAANTALQPSDILVMVPSLPDYAPHIQAVFGTAYRQGQLIIPFSLANQTAAEADSDTQAFLSLLRVVASDFQAQMFFECLNEQPLRERFGLQSTHLQTLRRWLLDSHFSGNFYDDSAGKFSSLEKLLDYLLLAYAADDEGQVGNRVAAPFYQAQQAETLTIFADIIPVFRGFSHLATQSQTLADWFAALQRLAMQFLPTPNGSNAVTEQLSAWFDSLSELEMTSTFDYATVMADIESMLQSEELRGPFLSGGVSFCAVQPMRAIPAKIIGLLGVGQNFPVIEAKNPLDLRRLQPRWSDHRPTKESRYFFLESLMAAREKLYLSYTGLDEKTGKRSPPSVLVSELVDFITRPLPNPSHYQAQLQRAYPLQGFMANNAQSYQQIYQTADQALSQDVIESESLAATPLAAEPLTHTWQAKQLATAIENPLLFYVQFVLQGQSLTSLPEPLREQAVVSLDHGLEQWQYRDAILQTALADESTVAAVPLEQRLQQRLQQQNLYAPTAISQPLIQQLSDEMQPLIAAVQAQKKNPCRTVLAAIEHQQHGQKYHFLLNGEMTTQGLFSYTAGGLTAKRLLAAWVNHVLFNVLDAEQYAIESYDSTLLTLDKGVLTQTQFAAFSQRAAAQAALERLMDFIVAIAARPYAFSYQKKSAYSQDFIYKAVDYPLYERLITAYPACSVDEMNTLFEPIAADIGALKVSSEK